MIRLVQDAEHQQEEGNQVNNQAAHAKDAMRLVELGKEQREVNQLKGKIALLHQRICDITRKNKRLEAAAVRRTNAFATSMNNGSIADDPSDGSNKRGFEKVSSLESKTDRCLSCTDFMGTSSEPTGIVETFSKILSRQGLYTLQYLARNGLGRRYSFVRRHRRFASG